MSYKSIHTGQQIDAGVSAALNPDTTPTEGSDALMISGGVKSALENGPTPVVMDFASSHLVTNHERLKLIVVGKICYARIAGMVNTDSGYNPSDPDDYLVLIPEQYRPSVVFDNCGELFVNPNSTPVYPIGVSPNGLLRVNNSIAKNMWVFGHAIWIAGV